LQLHTVHEEHCDGGFVLPDGIEENVLDVLGLFGGHVGVTLFILLLSLPSAIPGGVAAAHCNRILSRAQPLIFKR
jgi:hypothetical protein